VTVPPSLNWNSYAPPSAKVHSGVRVE
jgi:hypothetical protein